MDCHLKNNFQCLSWVHKHEEDSLISASVKSWNWLMLTESCGKWPRLLCAFLPVQEVWAQKEREELPLFSFPVPGWSWKELQLAGSKCKQEHGPPHRCSRLRLSSFFLISVCDLGWLWELEEAVSKVGSVWYTRKYSIADGDGVMAVGVSGCGDYWHVSEQQPLQYGSFIVSLLQCQPLGCFHSQAPCSALTVWLTITLSTKY